MAEQNIMNDLKSIIIETMRSETVKIVEEEAKRAGDAVEKRIRGMAGKVAMEATNHYSILDRTDSLIITINKRN